MKMFTRVAALVAILSLPAVAQVADLTAQATLDAADEAVTINLSTRDAVTASVAGTYTGTLTPEVSSDGTTWVGVRFYSPVTDSAATTTTSTGSFVLLGTGGFGLARVRASALSGGSVVVRLRATGAAPVKISDAISQSSSASVPFTVTKVGPSGASQPDDWRTPSNVTAVEASSSASALFASTPAKTVGGCFSPWTATVYYGGSGVTSANGMPLAASQSVCFDAFNLAGWYVVTASGTTSVRVQSYQSNL